MPTLTGKFLEACAWLLAVLFSLVLAAGVVFGLWAVQQPAFSPALYTLHAWFGPWLALLGELLCLNIAVDYLHHRLAQRYWARTQGSNKIALLR